MRNNGNQEKRRWKGRGGRNLSSADKLSEEISDLVLDFISSGTWKLLFVLKTFLAWGSWKNF